MGRKATRSEDPHEYVEPHVGQVWYPMDSRKIGGSITIISVSKTHCRVLSNTSGRRTQIRIDRFKPSSNGYKYSGNLENKVK